MATKLGLDAWLGLEAGGLGTSTMEEVSNVENVTLNIASEEANATTRANGGWKATEPTLHDASLSFSMVWDPEDAGFAKVQAAHLSRSLLGVHVLDEAGGEGLAANMKVTSFTRNEELTDVLRVDVEMKVARSAIAPSWITPGP